MVCLDTLTIWYNGGSGTYEAPIQNPPCTSTTVREVLSQTTLSLDNCYSTSRSGDPLDLDGTWFNEVGFDSNPTIYKISCPEPAKPLYSHGHIDTLHMRRVQKTITDYSAMRGPCSEGYHVPMLTEWNGLKTIMTGLSITAGSDWKTKLHIPFSGYRSYNSAGIYSQGTEGYYWSASAYSYYGNYNLYVVNIISSDMRTNVNWFRSDGCFIRPFKDEFVVPTSSWTVIQGTIGSAGIFRNQTNGLISITSDGSTGYTIADKNLGATTVYSDGDTLTQTNMGNMYQRGNNYGFPSTGSISKTSSTQIDTNGYGPGNYYDSDTFIKGASDRSSVDNRDLRGGVTGKKTITVDRREPVYYGPEITLLSYEEILAMDGNDKADDIVAVLNEHPLEYYNKLSSEGHLILDTYHTGASDGYAISDTNNDSMIFNGMSSIRKCGHTYIGYILSTGLRDYYCSSEPI